MSSSGRKPNSRGGRGGGRRRGKPKEKPKSYTNNGGTAKLRDEEILIAFAPFVRDENPQAIKIQETFQLDNNQESFVRAARQFLENPHYEPEPSLPPVADIPCAADLEEEMTGLTVKEDPVVHVIQSPNRKSPASQSGTHIASPISPPPLGNWQPNPPGLSITPPGIPMTPDSAVTTPVIRQSLVETHIPETAPTTTETLTAKPKHVYQPKRLWTRIEEQPGRILANNVVIGNTLTLRPRQEFTAQWMLPVNYVKQHVSEKGQEMASLRDALTHLTVGLFRRGCTENSSSIISKEVVSEERRDYPFQIKGDIVVGSIPFYSPRTPGNVVLRLYWDDDAIYTLATGPTLNVKVSQADVEPMLRFILSNFKAKKGSATSLSSLHSFTIVLETFQGYPNNNRQGWEGAGRATWGCLCESRKVYEVCAKEYLKQKDKLTKLQVEVEELRKQIEEEGDASDESAEKLKDKTGALMGGRASNERKWRDAQVTFANLLKALVTNPSCQLLTSRDIISRAQLEFELWCPLCESFAPSPFNSDKDALCANIEEFPHPRTPTHFRQCAQNRAKMQVDSLGFIPSDKPLEQILIPPQNKRQGQQHSQAMDPAAVDVMNRLSASMGELYQKEYLVSDQIHKQRELVRSHVNSFLSRCDAFPQGTRVVVFGSSANGFGSPSSDLDMCLQLPPNMKLPDEDDDTGAKAMAKLAELFEAGGMKDVNTERLTARIPIVMFSCPRPMAGQGQDELVECDLSMQNPLACLNTSLLLTYSEIHPVTRVLASIIKRWAKNRDINSPSNHTLSTYGYILMLLHFLTYHSRTESGLVTTVDKRGNNQETLTPLLPNLQWMDPRWPDSPPRTPYLEMNAKPKQLLVHPLDPNGFVVNTYFYRLNDPAALARVQQRFPGQNLSLSVLLASFFRYYAYEFDYKRHVVSLNATASKGMVDREEKAELDCWRAYGTGLSIEDPFETFYDVAHVVKGSNFHRIRNEFAMAYTKIVSVATAQAGSWEDQDVKNMLGSDLIDWICEPYVKEEQKD